MSKKRPKKAPLERGPGRCPAGSCAARGGAVGLGLREAVGCLGAAERQKCGRHGDGGLGATNGWLVDGLNL